MDAVRWRNEGNPIGGIMLAQGYDAHFRTPAAQKERGLNAVGTGSKLDVHHCHGIFQVGLVHEKVFAGGESSHYADGRRLTQRLPQKIAKQIFVLHQDHRNRGQPSTSFRANWGDIPPWATLRDSLYYSQFSS